MALWRLLDDRVTTRLGGGGARGGSKSGGGRRCMLLRRFKYPNTTGLILRRTSVQLYQSHVIKLFEEFPKLARGYNEQRKELVLPNGSRLFFGHGKDIANYYSAEFADIMVDEAQEFSQQELEKLSGSNRCTSNPDITPKMLFTFMPGISEDGTPPIGLPYLKRVFIDKDIRGEEKKHVWAFWQAFSWDNIEWARKELGWIKDAAGNWQLTEHGISEAEFYSWSEGERREFFINQTEFGQTLSGLTDKALRDAWLYGKWDIFKGQYYPNFSREKHVRPHAEVTERIKPWHTRWISGDYGYDHPQAVHWFAMDEKQHVYIYREDWARERGEIEWGKRIGELSAGEKLTQFWFSWDAFGKLNPKTRKSITQMLGDALPPGVPRPVPADKTPGSRIQRARLLHQFLDAEMLTISDECKHLIDELPSLVRDPENTEDVLKVDWSQNGIGDDAYDSASMGLANQLTGGSAPKAVQLENRMKEIRRQMMGQNQEGQPTIGDPFAKFGGKKL
jgi:hypothetical protein